MKRLLIYFLLVFILILLLLPISNTLNELLTKFIEKTSLYKGVEVVVLPYISRLLYGTMRFLPGIEVGYFPAGIVVGGTRVYVNWNCLGWQSYLFFFITVAIEFYSAHYTKSSKLKAFMFGFLGTFLLNFLRLVFTAALVGWSPGLFKILFHDYFASFLTIIWLGFFWWFSFSYILETDSSQDTA